MLETRYLRRGVDEVDPAAWDRLVGPGGSPFLEWDFLAACERHSARPERGVAPRHVTLWDGGELVAAAPLYEKADGRAEFIYDWSWHEAAARAGIPYYPKLVSMAPFTPVPAARLLVAPGRDPAPLRRSLVEGAEALARRDGLRGVHWLYVPPDEAAPFEEQGYLRRVSAQLAWRDPGVGDVDGWLAGFRSKDRIKLRRERRRLDEAGLALEVLEGDALGPADLADMQSFYLATCAAYGTGSDYLRPGTWELLVGWRRRLLLLFARRGAERVAGALFVRKGEALYGRYWGARGAWHSLYFNLTIYRPLELAIARGWRLFHVGAGNSWHKWSRGLDAEPVLSFHRLFDPRLEQAVARSLEQERPAVEAEIAALRAASHRRPPGAPPTDPRP